MALPPGHSFVMIACCAIRGKTLIPTVKLGFCEVAKAEFSDL
jgi:hypothetical protein